MVNVKSDEVNKMNERIKLLAEQCGFRSDPDIYDRNQSFDVPKFAELIINECLTICEELGDKGMDGHYCADEISKTFRSSEISEIKNEHRR
jgi:hypothetical protein